MIDMHNSTARIGLDEIRAGGLAYVSDPEAFARFAAGVALTPGLLLDQSWRNPGGATAGFSYFNAVMHHALPRIYDVRHLERLGGRFALRLTATGDYTVAAVNRRVVTLSGLPIDETTGESVADAELRPDVFMAFFNGLLAELADATLARIGAARAAVAAAA